MIGCKLYTYCFSLFWLLLAVTAVFTMTDRFMDPMLLPKWYACVMAFIVGIIVFSIMFSFGKVIVDVLFLYKEISRLTNYVVFIEALISVLQLCGIFQINIGSSVGTFDNLAGFSACLSLSFPVGFLHYSEYKKKERLFFIISKVLSVFALALYGSRTGLISVLLVLIIISFRRYKQKIVFSLLFLILSIPLSAVLLKVDSANGRWFISCRTFEMICKHPIMGWGQNGFVANYMDVQAQYFGSYPDSPYSILADNIHHPLNEFLLIGVNYGILGVILVFGFLLFTFVLYVRDNTPHKREGLLILICILIQSSFSYPFSYPFSYLLLVLSLLLIFSKRVYRLQNFMWNRIFFILLVICMSFCMASMIRKTVAQMKWKYVSEQANILLPDDIKLAYAELYPTLGSNIDFLYDYATEMFLGEKYELSFQLVRKIQSQISDYNLQLLIGDLYEANKNHQMAIQSYEKASLMCPSKVAPLYETYKIYRNLNDTANCMRIYEQLSNKKIKVNNILVNRMIEEVDSDVRFFLEHNN